MQGFLILANIDTGKYSQVFYLTCNSDKVKECEMLVKSPGDGA